METKTEIGDTPLAIAALSGRLGAVRLLLCSMTFPLPDLELQAAGFKFVLNQSACTALQIGRSSSASLGPELSLSVP